jgi:hypothetical protein
MSAYLDFIIVCCENEKMQCILYSIGDQYEPLQRESISRLLNDMTEQGQIFMQCLTEDGDEGKQGASLEEIPEEDEEDFDD